MQIIAGHSLGVVAAIALLFGGMGVYEAVKYPALQCDGWCFTFRITLLVLGAIGATWYQIWYRRPNR